MSRKGKSGMSNGSGGALPPTAAPSGGSVRFSKSEIENATDNYWSTGYNNKREAARVLSGDITESEYAKEYAKNGMKSDKTIQKQIDERGRDYTNRNWEPKSQSQWEAEGRETYKNQLERAKSYSVQDSAKRLGVNVNYSTSVSEARRILGNATYDAILESSIASARKAVNAHKRRRK